MEQESPLLSRMLKSTDPAVPRAEWQYSGLDIKKHLKFLRENNLEPWVTIGYNPETSAPIQRNFDTGEHRELERWCEIGGIAL